MGRQHQPVARLQDQVRLARHVEDDAALQADERFLKRVRMLGIAVVRAVAPRVVGEAGVVKLPAQRRGVGATRFGAEVMLDLLAGESTERTSLEMVRKKPLPFPPEPFAWTGIALTKWSLARADAHGGRRNLWLRTMDRLGLGFDS